MTEKKKKRIIRFGALTWLLLCLAAAVFLLSLWNFPLIPKKYKYVALGVCGLLVLIMGSVCLPGRTRKHPIAAFFNVVLIVCLVVASVFLPSLQSKVEGMFTNGDSYTTYNVYTLTEKYKIEAETIYKDAVQPASLSECKGRSFAVVNITDADMSSVLSKLKNAVNTDNLQDTEYDNLFAALGALYDGKKDLLMMDSKYEASVSQLSAYSTFPEDTVLVGTVKVATEKIAVSKLTEKPFTVAVLGSDDDEGTGLSTVTRTDVVMTATVNPITGQIILVSYPRDSFVPNPAVGNAYDKLTHMGMYGIDNTVTALRKWTGIPVHDYVLVNFQTFTTIVDVMGGVTFNNPYEFTTYYNEITFPAGEITLNGTYALEYVRERKNLPNGDFDRNEHQAIVMKALIDELTSPSVIGKADELLQALQGQFLTSLNASDIMSLAQYTMDESVHWDILSYHLVGSFGDEYTASAPEFLASVVYPDEEELQQIVEQVNLVLDGQQVTQQEITSDLVDETH